MECTIVTWQVAQELSQVKGVVKLLVAQNAAFEGFLAGQ